MTAAAPRQLSPEELQAYQRNGVILLKNVLSTAEIQAGRAAVDAAICNPGPQAEFLSDNVSTWDSVKGTFDDGAGEEDNSTNDANIRDEHASSSWTMFQDQFAPRATLFYDHVIVKKPTPTKTANVIPWHQDLPYWAVQGTLVSVWMCFDEMPPEAAVQWILGSHQWGLYQPRHFVDASPYQGTEDMTPMPDNLDERVAAGTLKATTFDAQPGDALLFDARIIHGSPGNASVADANKDGAVSETAASHTTSPPKQNIPHRRVAIRFAGNDVRFCQYKDPETGAITRETAIPTPDICHSLKG
ncbi:MAG: hypothetical protein SGARI_006236, partial [Bacillariaceae sp.]